MQSLFLKQLEVSLDVEIYNKLDITNKISKKKGKR